MSEDEFEQMVTYWPELFHKSNLDYKDVFTIGTGWLGILNALFETFTEELHHLKLTRNILGALDYESHRCAISDMDKRIKTEFEGLPIITTLKQDLGKLHITIDSDNGDHFKYLKVAINMSIRTCEVCGLPGSTAMFKEHGTIRTLCENHGMIERTLLH